MVSAYNVVIGHDGHGGGRGPCMPTLPHPEAFACNIYKRETLPPTSYNEKKMLEKGHPGVRGPDVPSQDLMR
ncbi:Hypothetical protein NTJ_10538 [Nesidiocoris tenuis]|uniref:Uncharacterized protein n=1 Tax=Nesidiocoris tenuis TaxID=355587 RepID=A0ABN7B2C1_9HEMI|nr:Hypothetical protein NTJ_10538 [Nesidiocoris tenuis]